MVSCGNCGDDTENEHVLCDDCDAEASKIVDELEARVKRLEAENAELRKRVCTCGSGAHPRHCKVHPEGFQAHCDELSYEAQLDELRERMSQLEAEANAARQQAEVFEREAAELRRLGGVLLGEVFCRCHENSGPWDAALAFDVVAKTGQSPTPKPGAGG